ncbi:hypothetical protein DENIS_3239 [Desulfonema ishimotonii]|uniref:Carboxypeptidase regulatory-like domain-containing protein n=1 Tax=Desulfonema ishimotonii TaxID=45657 RepID=A0A401FZ86_9BACT|nr:hypothetical protein [Desulfonema ishimotonii]GBC62270.1 hypothetical protein DENIS_3239 [Desulfonema ishimotonii]
MNAKFEMIFRRMLCFFIILSAAGCTTTVRGRVVDAETGEPVEGAVYAIHWYQLRGCCLGIRFGDGSGKEVLEVADGFTDADGYFEVPKYAHTLIMPPIFRMGVYKKGYAVWDDEDTVRWDKIDEYKAGKRDEEVIFPRRWELRNGMVIRLEPWKDSYSRYAHASFVSFFSGRSGVNYRLFEEAVRSERDFIRKRRKEYQDYLEKLENNLKRSGKIKE